MQTLRDRRGILAAVEYSDDGGDVISQIVIDRERESLGEGAMQVGNRFGMNAREQGKRIDVGEQAVEEILSDACLLPSS